MSLFEAKKLVIIDIDFQEKKTTDLELKYDILSKQFWKISQETILLISGANPDKRSRFYKEITQHADSVKIFDEQKSHDLIQKIQQKHGNYISRWAIQILSRYKSENYQKISSEIEKLHILYPSIEEQHIYNHIVPELEESIFTLVDAILNKNTKLALTTLNIMSQDTNIYLLYNSLIANLRTTYYIGILKSKKIPLQMIRNELKLWNRWFLVDKNYAMNSSDIFSLYRELITIDRNMKTGKLIGSSDKDFVFEIERALCKLL